MQLILHVTQLSVSCPANIMYCYVIDQENSLMLLFTKLIQIILTSDLTYSYSADDVIGMFLLLSRLRPGGPWNFRRALWQSRRN